MKKITKSAPIPSKRPVSAPPALEATWAVTVDGMLLATAVTVPIGPIGGLVLPEPPVEACEAPVELVDVCEDSAGRGTGGSPSAPVVTAAVEVDTSSAQCESEVLLAEPACE